MSKVSSGCCCSHYHINHKTSNTLAGSALRVPPLNRSGRSSNSFQPTYRHNLCKDPEFAINVKIDVWPRCVLFGVLLVYVLSWIFGDDGSW